MKPAVLIFYAGILYKSCPTLNDFWLLKNQCGAEIYNGAYVYLRGSAYVLDGAGWFRMDSTPVLIEDVPKELRLLLLLLT